MKKKSHKPRHLLAGILLIILAATLLSITGFFLIKKYAHAPSLATLLPADETLIFSELQLDTKTPQLAQLFSDIPLASILEFQEFDFATGTELLKLAQGRIGIAFFGEQPNPQNFALILDFSEKQQVLDFFQQQTLADEELQTKKFLNQTIYSYPRSHQLAFMLTGRDFILASDLPTLEKIATTIHIPEKNIRNHPSYHKVIAKLNPRENFIFLSPRFIDALFENRFTGMQQAFATPLLDLWTSGGANLTAKNGGLEIKTQLILHDHLARNPIFQTGKTFDTELLNLLGEETQLFFASHALATQVSHFLEQSHNLDSPITALTKSLLNKNIQIWFGSAFTQQNLSQLLTNNSVIGATTSGGIFGIFEENISPLIEKLKTADGKIASKKTLVALPDTTPGHELQAQDQLEVKEELYASHKITVLKFPNYELNFTQLDDRSVITTERATIEKIISRFVSEEQTFGDWIAENTNPSANLYYTRIENSPVPLLQPFRYLTIANNFTADSAKFDIFLGK